MQPIVLARPMVKGSCLVPDDVWCLIHPVNAINRKRPEDIRAFPTPKPYHKTMEMVS